MFNLFELFLLSILGSIIGLLGGAVFLLSKNLSKILQKHSVPFAAGVLITISLLTLIPESIDQIGEQALLVVLAAFFITYLVEHFVIDIHHHEQEVGHKHEISSFLVIVGDTIHNFIDGIAIAASYFVNPSLGLVTSLSTFLHEVPHEIGDFAVLLNAGYSRKKVFLINFISSCFTIFGAFTAVFFAENHTFLGVMLAISAGIFLYLGTIDFLPNIHHGYSKKSQPIIPLVLGILIMILTLTLIPHGH